MSVLRIQRKLKASFIVSKLKKIYQAAKKTQSQKCNDFKGRKYNHFKERKLTQFKVNLKVCQVLKAFPNRYLCNQLRVQDTSKSKNFDQNITVKSNTRHNCTAIKEKTRHETKIKHGKKNKKNLCKE
jgi:hypothetical protein